MITQKVDKEQPASGESKEPEETRAADTTQEISTEPDRIKEENKPETKVAEQATVRVPRSTKPLIAQNQPKQKLDQLPLDVEKEEVATLQSENLSGAGAAGIKTDSALVGVVSGVELTKREDSPRVTQSSNLAKTELMTIAPAQQLIAAEEKVTTERAKRHSSTPYVINGKITDQDGRALPGVNIIAKGTNNGTVSNAEGKYSLTVPQPDQTLTYSFIGFIAQEQNLNLDNAKTAALDVQLEEDATQLSEIVVTGYGEKKAGDEPVVRLAEPYGGRKAYDQYLDEKKMYPQQAIENKVEGRVIIEFTVGSTGTISEFNVVRKLGFGCDEEVIRLVKEGPQWRPSYVDNEPVESLVRIKTRFKLPQK